MADTNKPSPLDSPPILIAVLIGIAMVFATLGWFGSRVTMAKIYGIVRSIQLPYLDQFIPYANRFDGGNLNRGVVPEFTAIYQNSIYYGLAMTMVTFLFMVVALSRLSKNDIKGLIKVKSPTGRGYEEVLNAYAKIEPSVQFFKDYPVLEYPTNIGTARQNYTAMEMLFYTGALRGVVKNRVDGRLPYLDIDRSVLKDWFVSRFGPVNPFYGMVNDKLADVAAIERAVDKLGWAEMLILYPAIQRAYGFYVEKKKEGFEANKQFVDDYIAGVWQELNQLKQIYGDAIELGFADEIDRQERNERFKGKVSKSRKLDAKQRKALRDASKKQKATQAEARRSLAEAEAVLNNGESDIRSFQGEMEAADPEQRADIARKIGKVQEQMREAVVRRDEALLTLNTAATVAYTSTRAISVHENIYIKGEAERSQNNGIARPMIVRASLTEAEMRNFNLSKSKKVSRPAELQFFGEVISKYADMGYLKCVEDARKGLKQLLTRHLTETTRQYPVYTGEDGRVVYQPGVKPNEEGAFNHKAQERLNQYAVAVEAILMKHAYQFGIVGSALIEARKSGILPPNNFRWMRFCTETEALWWFVHNVGMPSSVPENAGSFEHFQLECTAKSGISKPYVDQAITGMQEEAERYLTEERIAEIKSILGNNAVIDEMVKRGRLEQAAIDEAGGDEAGGGQSLIEETALDQLIKGVEAKAKGSGADNDTDVEEGLEDVLPEPSVKEAATDDLDDFFN